MNLLFTLIVIGSLFPAIYLNPRIFAVTGVAYLLLLCETMCSQTRSFLRSIMKPRDLQVYLLSLGAAPPHIQYKI